MITAEEARKIVFETNEFKEELNWVNGEIMKASKNGETTMALDVSSAMVSHLRQLGFDVTLNEWGSVLRIEW